MNVTGLKCEPKQKDCEVWPEHAAALKIFLLCDQQWRVNEKFLGLDMVPVLQVAPLYTELTASLLQDIKVISTRATELLNQQQRNV